MTQGVARILVVEDEESLAEGIAENLALEGYEPQIVGDGQRALEMIQAESWDLVLLDVMLPSMDGFTICKTVRDAGSEVPVLFLTAKGLTNDRIRGLEAGGDDYLAKPFALRELLLRVSAILKRRQWYGNLAPDDAVLRFAGNEVDFRTYRGTDWDGTEHHLTHKESMILKCLAEREGEIVSREEVLERVWGYEIFPSTRTIDNFVLRLRKRFERDPEHPVHLHTERGIGYRFTRSPEQEESK
jgi:two-component system alkaline phosphatase synthesis response regulator PhoP